MDVPIVARRARERRRPWTAIGSEAERAPLTRERVLRAALDLADERGIESLSCASSAAVDVEAMSLYNHVSNKDDVLDGMLDLAVARSTYHGRR